MILALLFTSFFLGAVTAVDDSLEDLTGRLPGTHPWAENPQRSPCEDCHDFYSKAIVWAKADRPEFKDHDELRSFIHGLCMIGNIVINRRLSFDCTNVKSLKEELTSLYHGEMTFKTFCQWPPYNCRKPIPTPEQLCADCEEFFTKVVLLLKFSKITSLRRVYQSIYIARRLCIFVIFNPDFSFNCTMEVLSSEDKIAALARGMEVDEFCQLPPYKCSKPNPRPIPNSTPKQLCANCDEYFTKVDPSIQHMQLTIQNAEDLSMYIAERVCIFVNRDFPSNCNKEVISLPDKIDLRARMRLQVEEFCRLPPYNCPKPIPKPCTDCHYFFGKALNSLTSKFPPNVNKLAKNTLDAVLAFECQTFGPFLDNAERILYCIWEVIDKIDEIFDMYIGNQTLDEFCESSPYNCPKT